MKKFTITVISLFMVLLISTVVSGLKFYGLVEEIRVALHKKVDVLNMEQLMDNPELTKEILKDGIKIYG